MEQVRKLAEELGREMELHRMGLDPFSFERWFADSQKPVAEAGDASSGMEVIRRTEQCWKQQRRRGVSAAASWTTDDASPLKPLLSIGKADLKVLTALVESKEVGSRCRHRASIAAWRWPGRSSSAPRELPTDIEGTPGGGGPHLCEIRGQAPASCKRDGVVGQETAG